MEIKFVILLNGYFSPVRMVDSEIQQIAKE